MFAEICFVLTTHSYKYVCEIQQDGSLMLFIARPIFSSKQVFPTIAGCMGEPSLGEHCFHSVVSWFSFLSMSSAAAGAAATVFMTYVHPASNRPSARAIAFA